jgi:hypothetical protein
LSRYASNILQVGVVPVMAGPGDEKAANAVGRGHLRASHADRDHVISTLKVAFVQGRLTKDEFDLRVSQTLTSRTHADLAALTADIPAGLTGAGAPRKAAPVPAHHPVNKPLMWSMSVLTLAGVASMGAAVLAEVFLLLVYGLLAVLIGAPVAGTLMLDSWRQTRPGGQLPLRPAQSGQAPEGEQSAGTGDELMLSEARNDARARHLPSHRVVQRLWQSVPTRRASAGLCT